MTTLILLFVVFIIICAPLILMALDFHSMKIRGQLWAKRAEDCGYKLLEDLDSIVLEESLKNNISWSMGIAPPILGIIGGRRKSLSQYATAIEISGDPCIQACLSNIHYSIYNTHMVLWHSISNDSRPEFHLRNRAYLDSSGHNILTRRYLFAPGRVRLQDPHYKSFLKAYNVFYTWGAKDKDDILKYCSNYLQETLLSQKNVLCVIVQKEYVMVLVKDKSNKRLENFSPIVELLSRTCR